MIIKAVDDKNIEEVRKLYEEAFPKAERKPFELMARKQEEGLMEILTIEKDIFMGLAITMLYEDMVLLDYFAIAETARENGAGSLALELIRTRYRGKRLLLEIESPDEAAPNNEQRLRRRNFYHRNGFLDTDISVKVFGVDLEVLTYQCPVGFEEYLSIYRHTVGSELSQKIEKRSK